MEPVASSLLCLFSALRFQRGPRRSERSQFDSCTRHVRNAMRSPVLASSNAAHHSPETTARMRRANNDMCDSRATRVEHAGRGPWLCRPRRQAARVAVSWFARARRPENARFTPKHWSWTRTSALDGARAIARTALKFRRCGRPTASWSQTNDDRWQSMPPTKSGSALAPDVGRGQQGRRHYRKSTGTNCLPMPFTPLR